MTNNLRIVRIDGGQHEILRDVDAWARAQDLARAGVTVSVFDDLDEKQPHIGTFEVVSWGFDENCQPTFRFRWVSAENEDS